MIKTKALVIAIVYVDDVCFIGTKGSLLLNKLKQKFMARWCEGDQSKALQEIPQFKLCYRICYNSPPGDSSEN